MPRYRLTVDTGGTFSDFVLLDEDTGRHRILKVPSTPDDPGRAVLDGLDVLESEGIAARDIVFFSHGTTVATNALLEEKGANVGLVVTEGFTGIYETMEQSRPYGPAVFDLGYQKPALLAPGRRTGEAAERIAADGTVRAALDEDSVERLITRFEEQGVEAVAVCLLFAFMNDAHERRVKEMLLEAHPEWWVSTSSELLPQIREYFRLSTVVINAYVSPILGRYVRKLEGELDELKVAPEARFTMQSNGGSAPFASTAGRAVGTILSGPAGGVTAGSALSRDTGAPNIITFDMGGTSTDVALIQDGEPVITDRSKIDGRDIAIPMLDITTVAAGGGTISRVDRHGALHVGPASAGAVPGPACYLRGGTEPTTTDCNVVLGYLDSGALLGGAMTIDRSLAEEAVRTGLADPLGMDLLRAAEGHVKIIDVQMGEAVKSISTERGFDLREFALVPFGGAGPLHACRIARDLGLAKVVIPLYPGAFSALGLLMSDVKHDYLRSRLSDIAAVDPAEMTALFEDLRRQGEEQLRAEGFAAHEMAFRYYADLRYAGQGYENPVPLSGLPRTPQDVAEIRADFDVIHEQCHGHNAPGQPVEVVNYRVEAYGRVPSVELAAVEEATGPATDAVVAMREAYFSEVSQTPFPVSVYQREKLRAGHTFDGPALIDQYDSTTVVCPGQHVTVDPLGNLIVENS
ncbi:hydantoinase/oxoprolinase family protein [Nocardioides sp. NPDC047086]|uniref:hydantoinase/oxoprolinase family protein n=1 Tax=Nocardioides sp. NPDC047086 TaxID=3154810 RepID=UPI003407ADEC